MPPAFAQSPHGYAAPTRGRQSFHRPHVSMGASGHWIHMLGLLVPLAIPEFIKEPDRQWRWVRMSAIGTAMLSEVLWTTHVNKEREREREECAAR